MWSNARGCPRVNRLHRQRPASGVQLQSRAATASANDMVCRSGPRGARRNSPLAALDSSPLVRLVRSPLRGPDRARSRAAAHSPVMPPAAVGILQASSASSPFTSMPRTKLRTGALRSGNAIQSCIPSPHAVPRSEGTDGRPEPSARREGHAPTAAARPEHAAAPRAMLIRTSDQRESGRRLVPGRGLAQLTDLRSQRPRPLHGAPRLAQDGPLAADRARDPPGRHHAARADRAAADGGHRAPAIQRYVPGMAPG